MKLVKLYTVTDRPLTYTLERCSKLIKQSAAAERVDLKGPGDFSTKMPYFAG